MRREEVEAGENTLKGLPLLFLSYSVEDIYLEPVLREEELRGIRHVRRKYLPKRIPSHLDMSEVEEEDSLDSQIFSHTEGVSHALVAYGLFFGTPPDIPKNGGAIEDSQVSSFDEFFSFRRYLEEIGNISYLKMVRIEYTASSRSDSRMGYREDFHPAVVKLERFLDKYPSTGRQIIDAIYMIRMGMGNPAVMRIEDTLPLELFTNIRASIEEETGIVMN